MARGEHAPLPPGIVRVRLQSGDGTAERLAARLAQVPGVEVLTGPDRYPGGRVYLTVRVTEQPAGDG